MLAPEVRVMRASQLEVKMRCRRSTGTTDARDVLVAAHSFALGDRHAVRHRMRISRDRAVVVPEDEIVSVSWTTSAGQPAPGGSPPWQRSTQSWRMYATVPSATAKTASTFAVDDEKPLPVALVDTLNKLFGGPHAGYRANHAKGVLVAGTFTPAASAASFSTPC